MDYSAEELREIVKDNSDKLDIELCRFKQIIDLNKFKNVFKEYVELRDNIDDWVDMKKYDDKCQEAKNSLRALFVKLNLNLDLFDNFLQFDYENVEKIVTRLIKERQDGINNVEMLKNKLIENLDICVSKIQVNNDDIVDVDNEKKDLVEIKSSIESEIKSLLEVYEKYNELEKKYAPDKLIERPMEEVILLVDLEEKVKNNSKKIKSLKFEIELNNKKISKLDSVIADLNNENNQLKEILNVELKRWKDEIDIVSRYSKFNDNSSQNMCHKFEDGVTRTVSFDNHEFSGFDVSFVSESLSNDGEMNEELSNQSLPDEHPSFYDEEVVEVSYVRPSDKEISRYSKVAHWFKDKFRKKMNKYTSAEMAYGMRNASISYELDTEEDLETMEFPDTDLGRKR